LRRRLRRTRTALLGGYVGAQGQALSSAFAEALQAAGEGAGASEGQREPRAPRPMCAQVLALLAAARADVAAAVDDSALQALDAGARAACPPPWMQRKRSPAQPLLLDSDCHYGRSLSGSVVVFNQRFPSACGWRCTGPKSRAGVRVVPAGRQGEWYDSPGGPAAGAGREGASMAVERSVARLFQDRGAPPAEVDFSQGSILGGAPANAAPLILSMRLPCKHVCLNSLSATVACGALHYCRQQGHACCACAGSMPPRAVEGRACRGVMRVRVGWRAGAVRMALKGAVELVRLQTLRRQALQQLQVDLHYLRPQLRRRGRLAPYMEMRKR
jgi:hypothetical protein